LKVRGNAVPMRALAMVACVVGAIAALWLTYLAVWDLYLTGFPDGHLTDYDKAVDAPKHVPEDAIIRPGTGENIWDGLTITQWSDDR
jgi:hypothetical protein